MSSNERELLLRALTALKQVQLRRNSELNLLADMERRQSEQFAKLDALCTRFDRLSKLHAKAKEAALVTAKESGNTLNPTQESAHESNEVEEQPEPTPRPEATNTEPSGLSSHVTPVSTDTATLQRAHNELKQQHEQLQERSQRLEHRCRELRGNAKHKLEQLKQLRVQLATAQHRATLESARAQQAESRARLAEAMLAANTRDSSDDDLDQTLPIVERS
ncbi:MAG: hypothetical protein MHM6MM_004520 [Cercozoa sp. M6MM]